jgi:hypothetical protein
MRRHTPFFGGWLLIFVVLNFVGDTEPHIWLPIAVLVAETIEGLRVLWMVVDWMVWLLVGFMALFACAHNHNPLACAWSHVGLVEKTAHSTTKQAQ